MCINRFGKYKIYICALYVYSLLLCFSICFLFFLFECCCCCWYFCLINFALRSLRTLITIHMHRKVPHIKSTRIILEHCSATHHYKRTRIFISLQICCKGTARNRANGIGRELLNSMFSIDSETIGKWARWRKAEGKIHYGGIRSNYYLNAVAIAAQLDQQHDTSLHIS